jgi:hypothetical protein
MTEPTAWKQRRDGDVLDALRSSRRRCAATEAGDGNPDGSADTDAVRPREAGS